MKLETQTHLTTLRQLLDFRLAELRAEVHAAQLAHLGPGGDANDVTDHKDAAELQREAAADDAQEARDLAELKQVEAALHRLDAGAYGDCAECGEPLPLTRLLALPAAERCAACQAEMEHRAAARA